MTPHVLASEEKSVRKQQELVAALQSLVRQVGPNVSLARFERESGFSRMPVYRWFGSWKNLRAAAGLPPDVDRSGRFGTYSREDLLAAMREAVARHGSALSLAEFTRQTKISIAPIQRHFGRWSRLRAAVGLPSYRPPGRPPRFSQSVLAGRLRDVVAEQGEITMKAFCRRLGVSEAVVRQYGTWGDLRERAGLPPSPWRRRYSKEELQQHLQRIVNERGDVTQPVFCRELGISKDVIARHGGWSELRREIKLPDQGCTGRPAWQAMLIGDLFDPERELPPELRPVI